MVSTEYLLLAGVVLFGAAAGLSEVRDGIEDAAKEHVKTQRQIIKDACKQCGNCNDASRTESGNRIGAVSP